MIQSTMSEWRVLMDLASLRRKDETIYKRLPPFMRRGEHLLLSNAMFHTQKPLNELNAVHYIIDHASDPFCPRTICDIYASLVKGTELEGKAFKRRNVVVSNKKSGHMYVTTTVEETPFEIEKLCRDYSHLNNPGDDDFEDIFRVFLLVQCIHPFEDGNGRFSSVLLQFLLQKADLRCAPLLPFDFMKYGPQMSLITTHIVYASGAYYGHKPMVFDKFIPFTSDLIVKSYGYLEDTLERYEMSLR